MKLFAKTVYFIGSSLFVGGLEIRASKVFMTVDAAGSGGNRERNCYGD